MELALEGSDGMLVELVLSDADGMAFEVARLDLDLSVDVLVEELLADAMGEDGGKTDLLVWVGKPATASSVLSA